MKAVIQKSGPASVTVNGEVVGRIDSGLVILLGIKNSDTSEDADYLAEKITNLRLFEENEKYFEQSVLEKGEETLVISQFTLYASCKKGRRPDFAEAAKSEIARSLYEEFLKKLNERGVNTATGVFGADMEVNLVNRGPVTIIIESENE